MALVKGQPPKPASPQEIGHQATKVGGRGRKARVSVCRNKQFEEGYWKDFLKLGSVFIVASQNFMF
jgi:hypothetical protein